MKPPRPASGLKRSLYNFSYSLRTVDSKWIKSAIPGAGELETRRERCFKT